MKELRACMHAFYTEANDRSKDDFILIKERVRDVNGVESVHLRKRENYVRDYWITLPDKRTHTKKKEYELLENLHPDNSTQARMANKIAKQLNLGGGYVGMDVIKSSPYVYGIDIPTTSLVRQQYKERYPEYNPEATVCSFDLETNVYSERGEIIMGAITFKKIALLVINKEWLGNVFEAEETIQDLFVKYLGEYKAKRDITLHVKIVKNDLAVVRTLFKGVHKLMPDFLSIWNMAFDITKILECLDYYKVDPTEIFCDPIVPERFRRFKWKLDDPKKKKVGGKTMSKHRADLWHVVNAPASFYIIDSMCFFKINRVREQARHSYSLNSILDEELGLGKLRFKEADAYGDGLEWHKFMQKNYKLEYAIYNIFDCLALELLDEKTGDLSKAVLAGLGITDPKNLTSGPTNLANELHFFLKKQGKIICTTAPDMTDTDFDDLVLDKTQWILTLSSDLVAREGEVFISDVGNMPSKLYTHVFDVDIASGYPTVGSIMNVSKETTLREVHAIDGLTNEELRRTGINMTALRTNAIELGQTVYGLPNLNKMLKEFIAENP